MNGLTQQFLVDQHRADLERLEPLFNLAPTEPAPIIIDDNGLRTLTVAHFGLVPSWAKDVKIAAQCINARAESVHEKPSFREAFQKRRCLVPADGYYEWQEIGTGKEK